MENYVFNPNFNLPLIQFKVTSKIQNYGQSDKISKIPYSIKTKNII